MALRRLIVDAFAIWGICVWLSVPVFLERTFGRVTVDQLAFFLFLPDGTIGTDISVLLNALNFLLINPALYTLIVFFPSYIVIKKYIWPSFLNGLWPKFLIVVVSFFYVLASLGVAGLFERNAGPDKFSEVYEPVDIGAYRPTKNLILLYVESLEIGYGDTSLFGRDLNKQLNSIFPRAPLSLSQAPGTGWTTAGMIASQCAVPLSGFMGNKLIHRRGPILGGVLCLSDLLDIAGYYQAFYVGPELTFSGMDKFYLNHGFDRAWGKREIDAELQKPDLNTGWGGGVNDDTLLDLAYQDIVDRWKKKTPFNVTIITTDNHAANGKLSPRCFQKFDGPQINHVIECTNSTIQRFANRLRADGVLEDTVLVVMGDHLFMANSEQKQFLAPKRFVYFNFLGGRTDLLLQKRDHLTHFDVLPSVMTMLGGLTPARVHLGSSIFAETSRQVSPLHDKVMDPSILNRSPVYDALWEIR